MLKNVVSNRRPVRLIRIMTQLETDHHFDTLNFYDKTGLLQKFDLCDSAALREIIDNIDNYF